MSCDPALAYGGALQHVAFFSSCRLCTTPVTAGYLTALVYSLHLHSSEEGEPVNFAAPVWPDAVTRLRALLNSWRSRFLAATSSEAPPGRSSAAHSSPLARHAIIALAIPETNIDTVGIASLQGVDKSTATLARMALEGCDAVGAYLAMLTATDHLTRDVEDEDEESDESDDDEWEVESTEWALRGFVELRSGAKFAAGYSQQLTRIDDDLVGCELVSDVDIDALFDGDDASICVDDDTRGVATRERRTTVLVIDIARDAWVELGATAGVDAAIKRMLSLVEQAPREDASRRTHLTDAGPVSSECAATPLSVLEELPLRADLLRRGPLSVLEGLFNLHELLRHDYRRCDGVRPPFLEAIQACPRLPSATAPLLSRILRRSASRLIEHDPIAVASALAAVAGESEPLSVICAAIRGGAFSMAGRPGFSGALALARRLLQNLPAAPAVQAVPSGTRRRRENGDDESDGKSHVDARSWLADAGRAVLAALVRSCYIVNDASAETGSVIDELLALLLHGNLAAEASRFVRDKLYVIANHPTSFSKMLVPRTSEDAAKSDMLGSAVAKGISTLLHEPNRRSGGALLLLSIGRAVLGLPVDASIPRDHPSAPEIEAPSASTISGACSSTGAVLAEPCTVLTRTLPKEPVEPADLVIMRSPTHPSAALGLCVAGAPPPTVAARVVRRILKAIVEAWPPVGSWAAKADLAALGMLFALLVARSHDSLAAMLLRRRLSGIVQHEPTAVFLSSRLFGDGPIATVARTGLWAGLRQGINDAMTQDDESDGYNRRHAVRHSAEAIGAFIPALVARAREAVVAARTAAVLPAWNPRRELAPALRCLASKWPTDEVDVGAKDFSAAALSVLRALCQWRDAATIALLLPRLSSKAILALAAEQSGRDPDLLLTALFKSLGWSVDVRVLALRITASIGLGDKQIPGYPPIDLGLVTRVGRSFARAAAATAFSTEALGVVRPVVSAIADVAVGRLRHRAVAQPSSDVCLDLATLLLSPLVSGTLEGVYASSPAGAWARYAASEAGRPVYPVDTLVEFVDRALSSALPLYDSESIPLVVMEGLVSAEKTRLSRPVPRVSWTRAPVCSQSCRINPDGPSSCLVVGSFLADAAAQAVTIAFSNKTKLKHVLSTLNRSDDSLAIDSTDYELRVTKRPDPVSDLVEYARALAQRHCDDERMGALRSLRSRARVAAECVEAAREAAAARLSAQAGVGTPPAGTAAAKTAVPHARR